MSTKKTQSDVLTPKQVALVFEEIASTADVVEQLTSMLSAEAFETEEDAAAVRVATQKLVQRIGMLAELYGKQCGSPYAMVKGGVDAWLMPRTFKSLEPALS